MLRNQEQDPHLGENIQAFIMSSPYTASAAHSQQSQQNPLMSSSSSSSSSSSATSSVRTLMKTPAPPSSSSSEQEVLKCPRCDSTNTKFCYYNNYSLTQPRHFCKTCRRYWTKGGSLRSVPVGGGCRKNSKRTTTNTTSSSSNPVTAINPNSSPTMLLNSVKHGSPDQPFPPSLLPRSHIAELNYHSNNNSIMDPDLGIISYAGLRQIDDPVFPPPPSSSSPSNFLETFSHYHLPGFSGLQSLQPPTAFLASDSTAIHSLSQPNFKGMVTPELGLAGHQPNANPSQPTTPIAEIYASPYLNMSLSHFQQQQNQSSMSQNEAAFDTIAATEAGTTTATTIGTAATTGGYWNSSAVPDFSAFGFSGLNPSSM